jgi:hypothetical protein
VRGLSPEIEFRGRKDRDRFPPLAGFEDSRRHLWVASAGGGLSEWIPDPSWRRWFPEDFGNDAAAQIVIERHGSVFLATNKNVYRGDPQSGRWIRLTHEEHRYYYLLPLDEGGFLASLRDLGLVRLSPEGAIVERLGDPSERLQDRTGYPLEERQIVRDGKGRIWVGAKRALLRVEGKPGAMRLVEEKLPDLAKKDLVQAVALAVDADGRLWAGYTRGIAWLDDNDHWRMLASDHPADLVRSFALAGDAIWVAHRNSGSYSELQRKGSSWRLTPFSARSGFGPVDTNFIAHDSRGWIWRGSTDGVHVADGRHLAAGDWLHFHPGNGLTVNEAGQYGFFEDRDGAVWIAGEEGVTQLRPDPAWFDAPRAAPPPRITRVEADGRVFLFPENPPAALLTATRVLRIDVGGLAASPFRDAPLRYRLLPISKEWQFSRDGCLEFRNLRDNAYSLQIGYAGNGESAVGSWAFRVGAGGAASLTWAWLIGLVAAGGAMVPAVRRVPWFARTRFRLERALFLMRRRSRYRNYQSDTPAEGNDYSGEMLLDRYRLGRIVSRGGFSIVYEAFDINDPGARVAVKVLNRGGRQDGWMRDRFAHEVSALRSVEHPGVVSILDSWITPAGEPCLAMPFLDGESLRAALQGGPLQPARAARITAQLGAALAAVHAHGIIHRDLKPENLMLAHPRTAAERAVIIDFGTAGLRTAEHELAATTLMSGSFHYMAPERLTGRYSPATDVFSLAVIVLEMLTGKRLADLRTMPFEPLFETELGQVLAQFIGSAAARELADLLATAYDTEPRRRPADVANWAERLAKAMLG